MHICTKSPCVGLYSLSFISVVGLCYFYVIFIHIFLVYAFNIVNYVSDGGKNILFAQHGPTLKFHRRIVSKALRYRF